MVKYLCIIQARASSNRLPLKVMLDLGGKTLLERVYDSVSKSNKIDDIIFATSFEKSDDIIDMKLDSLGIKSFRGDLNNVLKRFYDVTKKYNAQNIVRVTADNPLTDGRLIDELITSFESSNSDYTTFSNCIYGLGSEVFTYDSLCLAYQNANTVFDKEHVTPYIKNNMKTDNINIEKKYQQSKINLSIDTFGDYLRLQEFYLFCIKYDIPPNIDTYIKFFLSNKK
jgi:spore coat polysaccharide biosynthesis protein SpsF